MDVVRTVFAVLAVSSLLADGKLLYFHDREICSGENATSYPYCNWHYLAYTPYKFRAGVAEKVLVLTHNIKFDVTVVGKLVDKDSKLIAASEEKVIKPGILTELVIKVPFNAPESGFVHVEGTAEVPKGTNGIPEDATWQFANKTSYIQIERTSTQVFIQTDRPIYKPGETIHARVLSVDSNLKAISGVISQVSIQNPTRTTMRLWRNVKLVDGFASFKLKLSIKPVLGSWRIKATIKGKQTTVNFDIEKYVLPKFQVKIAPPPFIAFGQTKVDGQICAKYSYGRDVSGRLNAKICVSHTFHYWSRKNNTKVCETIKRTISGCEPFVIDMDFFKLYESFGDFVDFSIDASVKEGATGITLKARSVMIHVKRDYVKISFKRTPNVFKPGLPFEAWVNAKYPDGSPADDVKVVVTVFSTYDDMLYNETVYIKRGAAKINLPKVPFNVKSLRFNARYQKKNLPKKEGRLSKYDRFSSAYHTAKAWYSPSSSYLGINKKDGNYKIGSKATINVKYTTGERETKKRTVYYSLMCKGTVTLARSTSVDFIKATAKRSKRSNEEEDVEEMDESQEPSSSESQDKNGTQSSMKTGMPNPQIERVDDIYPPFKYWTAKPITRPPLPEHYSTGSFDISFKVTQEMSPLCRLLVYYIKGKETVADSVVIDTEDSFPNKVSMKFSEEQVFPGDKVKLTLKASPGSRFAISAVDKSIHFLRDANELKAGTVHTIVRDLDIGADKTSHGRCGQYFYFDYYGENFIDSEQAFRDAGMIPLSNMMIDSRPCPTHDYLFRFESVDGVNGGTRRSESGQSSRVRSNFPETWLWTDEKFDSKTGEKVIEVTVPDTITTWYASGFAVSDQTGLGVASPAEIIGFKSVFVSLSLPYSVIRGEIVSLPVVIFNYMSDCLHVNVSMKDSKDFRSLTRSHADFCICGGQSARVIFKIKAKKIGRINIQAQAETLTTNSCPKHVKFDSSKYIDIVRKKLLVEPEGIEKEYTYNSLVCPKERTVVEKTKLSIPKDAVSGSVYAELRIVGDLMGPSLSGLDSLLKIPYGCGEQNMLNFAPNIFIMKYLKATGQLTAEIREKSIGYTLQGYQRELTYQHDDGSYSAFGKKDEEGGSMWLTAFVLKSFAQARPFIQIDRKVLSVAKRWIISKQTKDGCFPTVGSLHHKAMKGGVSSPVTLTGYVVAALLEADMDKDSTTISDAIEKCIKPNLENVTDSYSVAILAYTMAKAGREKELAFLVKKLDSLAVKEDGVRHWEAPKPPKEEKKDNWFYQPYYQARSADIEMTAYALMALLEGKGQEKALDAIDIVRWLSQQRNSLGGWASTQDTVLAMQVLAQYAELVYGGEVDMSIDVSIPGLQHRFAVNSKNNLVLQRIQLPSKFPAVLKTFATGKGCALMSASVKYNVPKVQEIAAFVLTVSVHPLQQKRGKVLKHGRCKSQEIMICASWAREGQSNMAIISVRMPSGFVPTKKSLDRAVYDNVLLKEYEQKGKEWNFYYSKIDLVCLGFDIQQENVVQGIKPASISVYDYYDKDLQATTTYEVKC